MRILSRTFAVLGGVALVAYVAVAFLAPATARELALGTGNLINAYPLAFVGSTLAAGAAVMFRAAFGAGRI
jgi:hypothetical protein